jgi:hypothetical protein
MNFTNPYKISQAKELPDYFKLKLDFSDFEPAFIQSIE